MAKYVAFLRGINVGGNRPVSMGRLKQAFESLGFTNVRTLLASGNVLFETPSRNSGTLIKRIEEKLRTSIGYDIGTVVRSVGALRKLEDLNPFKGVPVTPATRLFVTFLSRRPKTGLKIPYESPDKSYRILHLTKGEVCSVLVLGPQWARNLRQMDILEREFGKQITTRSWNTVVRVLKTSAS